MLFFPMEMDISRLPVVGRGVIFGEIMFKVFLF